MRTPGVLSIDSVECRRCSDAPNAEAIGELLQARNEAAEAAAAAAVAHDEGQQQTPAEDPGEPVAMQEEEAEADAAEEAEADAGKQQRAGLNDVTSFAKNSAATVDRQQLYKAAVGVTGGDSLKRKLPAAASGNPFARKKQSKA